MNQLHAKRQGEYVSKINDLNIAHTNETTEISRQYREDCAKRDKAHTTEISTLRADYNDRISKLNA